MRKLDDKQLQYLVQLSTLCFLEEKIVNFFSTPIVDDRRKIFSDWLQILGIIPEYMSILIKEIILIEQN